MRDRPPGQSIPQALRARLDRRYLDPVEHPVFADFLALIRATPALREYELRMARRHERSLAAAIATEIGAAPDDVACATLARLALEASDIAHGYDDPAAALDRIFDLIDRGWTASTGSGVG